MHMIPIACRFSRAHKQKHLQRSVISYPIIDSGRFRDPAIDGIGRTGDSLASSRIQPIPFSNPIKHPPLLILQSSKEPLFVHLGHIEGYHQTSIEPLEAL